MIYLHTIKPTNAMKNWFKDYGKHAELQTYTTLNIILIHSKTYIYTHTIKF